jgi:putative copper resistance protein D
VPEVVGIAARLAQFAAAMILLGAPFFFLRTFRGAGGPAPSWTRAWLWGSVALLLAGGLASAMAQTAMMFGESAAAFRAGDVVSVLLDTQVGRGLAVRLALGLAFAVLLASRRSDRATWAGGVGLGALIAASFAWTGHGAATEGPGGTVHLVSDIIHTLAAAVWLGALVPLLVLVLRARRAAASPDERWLAHDGLEGFSGVGTIVVALLVVTGVVNSWFLVGPANIFALPSSLYGQLLLAKLALFVLMLALAAANRFRLTPALQRGLDSTPDAALAALRRSLFIETLAGLLVLGAVSVLGTLAPVSAV